MALLPIQHQIPATSNFPLSAVARLIESLVAATVAVLTIGCLVKADILLFLGGFLSVPPERESLDSGTGSWKLAFREGRQQVQLDFSSREGVKAAEVPFGVQLELSSRWGKPYLFYFFRDPDEGRRVEFERSK